MPVLCDHRPQLLQTPYGDPPCPEYRDLRVIRLAGDGRCIWFEEWPYWLERP